MNAVVDVFTRSALNYDMDAVSFDTGIRCDDVSRTQQSFQEECDINTIIRRFAIGGELPKGVRMPTYGDFTGVNDFHSAVNAIAMAHEAFDEMPAEVRYRFNNDPAAFLAFCSDDANLPEARRLGLVPALEAPVEGPTGPVVTSVPSFSSSTLSTSAAVPAASGAVSAPSGTVST